MSSPRFKDFTQAEEDVIEEALIRRCPDDDDFFSDAEAKKTQKALLKEIKSR